MDKISFPKCTYLHGSCFAYLGGKCLLLTDTKFKERDDCPFYKDAKEGKVARDLLFQELDRLSKKKEAG